MDALKLMDMVSTEDHLDQFKNFNWTGSFEEYLDMLSKDPSIARTAFQRIYDMIMSYGTKKLYRI